jgi:hypothetical protein
MPHPLRESLFERADFLLRPGGALRHFEKFVVSERTKLFTRLDRRGCFVRVSLPPAAALVVREASSAGDILKVALEVRSKFKAVRAWLADLQAAFETGRVKGMAPGEKLLKSVASNVDGLTGDYSEGETSLQCGASWLKVGFKVGRLINKIRNHVGVRAAVNRLIVADGGLDGLRKAIGFFESDQKRMVAIEHAFLRRNEAIRRTTEN